MPSFRKLLFVGLFSAALGSSFASAHTPYIAPATFEPLFQGWVTLDASFADAFFIPEVVFDNSEFHVIDPAGVKSAPLTVERLKTRAVVEHQLKEKGTYRFSTGVRHGAIFRTYEQNGERKSLRDPKEALPEGAKLLDHFQSVTLAESYITLGAPNENALKPYGKGLEVVAVSHPNDVYEGEKFRLQVQFDGKPLADQSVQIFPTYVGKDGHAKAILDVKTDSKGFADLALPKAATYLLQTRYRHAAPKGAEAPQYSYTYTLSFEVGKQ